MLIHKEGALKPTPSPILVRRFTGAGGWHDTCAGIMGLTKMDWNNNTLHKKLPVTLEIVLYRSAFGSLMRQYQLWCLTSVRRNRMRPGFSY
jgi:hypothetical protein